MSHAEYIANADFSDYITHPRLPVAGLNAEYFFGSSFSDTNQNIAKASAIGNLTQIDVPTYGENYAECQCGLSGFDLGIDADVESTFMVVLSQPDTGASSVAMAGFGDASFSVGRLSADIRIRCGENASNLGAFFPQTNVWSLPPGSSYGFFVMQNKGVPNRSQFYGAGGAINEVISNGPFSGARKPSRALIGGPTMTASSSNTKFRVAYAAQFQRFLTEPELLFAYLNVQAALIKRGIVVT